MKRRFALLLSIFTALMTAAPLESQAQESADNLMAILRESPGSNRPTEALSPISKVEAPLPDGRTATVYPAWFQFIGDMHIRFVFDGQVSMKSATQDDMRRLGLSPERALNVAIANLHRVYGEPRATPWNDLLQVEGKSPDYNSSYFLDRSFWRKLLANHPEGIVVAVPKRGGLLYTPASNQSAVARLRQNIGYLYKTSDQARISSAIYLFKDDKWTVLSPPQGAQ